MHETLKEINLLIYLSMCNLCLTCEKYYTSVIGPSVFEAVQNSARMHRIPDKNIKNQQLIKVSNIHPSFIVINSAIYFLFFHITENTQSCMLAYILAT